MAWHYCTISSSGASVDASFSSMSSLASSASSGSNGYELESEVGREALREICCSALSRVLDFPDSHLETLLGFDEDEGQGGRGDDVTGMNVARNIASSLRLMKQSISSGMSTLSHIYHHHHHRQGTQEMREEVPDGDEAIPTLKLGAPISSDSQIILLQLITHMQSFITYEGLFRKPGSRSRIDLMVQEMAERGIDDIILNGAYKSHDFASVLKQCFAELPEPLLLKRHLEAYLQASVLSSQASISRCLQLLMLLLPPSHRVVLQHLLELLSQIAAYQENKMDTHNLALVFAPTLFLHSRSDFIPAESLEKLVSLLKYMISNSVEIFEVPAEVQVVADRYCKKKSRTQEEDIPLEMYSTYCKQICPDDFHSAGREKALAEVAALYEYVQKMPDGPQKTHFMKRFEAGNKTPGTPSVFTRKSKSRRNKENFATPKLSQGCRPGQLSKSAQPHFGKRSSRMLQKRLQCETPTSAKVDSVLNGSETPNLKSRVLQVATNSPLVTDV